MIVKKKGDFALFNVWDSDLGNDDHIGSTKISIYDLIKRPSTHFSIFTF